jgi:hypothetical protein
MSPRELTVNANLISTKAYLIKSSLARLDAMKVRPSAAEKPLAWRVPTAWLKPCPLTYPDELRSVWTAGSGCPYASGVATGTRAGVPAPHGQSDTKP